MGRAAPPEPMDVLAGVPSAFDAGRQGQGPDADAQVIGRQQKRNCLAWSPPTNARCNMPAQGCA